MVVAHELGLGSRIETLPSAAGPVARDATIRRDNPLGQVPTFFADDGTVHIGTITLGCGLGYLDFRFPDYDWRSGRAPETTHDFGTSAEAPARRRRCVA